LINLPKQEIISAVEKKLDILLLNNDNLILMEAMRYSTLDGGKRIRPLLTVASGNLSAATFDSLITIGAAIELIHCYSLIHDDLPAMDNDDLRRGRPTCHKKYNEAIAILAGDALQTKAFAVISDDELLISDNSKLKIIQTLAKSAGVSGMVGGQSLDLISTGLHLSLPELQNMHMKKTGALIKAAILCGYLAGHKYSKDIYYKLSTVADNLGLLFQIADDILDFTSDTQTLGKTAHKDLVYSKATYVNILGLDSAQAMAKELFNQTLTILQALPMSEQLIELTHFIYERSN
jgi:farnesyl diphosphate synthase